MAPTTTAPTDDGAADDGAVATTAPPADDADGDDEMADDEMADDEMAEEGGDHGGAAAEAGSIVINDVSFSSNTVTVTNVGSEPIDTADWFTCNRPQYDSVLVGVIEPGATVEIDVTALDIRPSGGEFGLYRSRSFDSAADLVAYVQWGGPGNGRASVAVEAGLIAEGEFVDNGEADFSVS